MVNELKRILMEEMEGLVYRANLGHEVKWVDIVDKIWYIKYISKTL